MYFSSTILAPMLRLVPSIRSGFELCQGTKESQVVAMKMEGVKRTQRVCPDMRGRLRPRCQRCAQGSRGHGRVWHPVSQSGTRLPPCSPVPFHSGLLSPAGDRPLLKNDASIFQIQMKGCRIVSVGRGPTG
jgi:hypothetical protein